jgi:hypothetical protein
MIHGDGLRKQKNEMLGDIKRHINNLSTQGDNKEMADLAQSHLLDLEKSFSTVLNLIEAMNCWTTRKRLS